MDSQTERHKASQAVQWLRKAVNKPDLKDKTAHQISECVILYITYLGGYASEIDNRGYFNPVTNKWQPSRTKNGIPDILACFKGRFIGIEVKAGNDRMRNEQLNTRLEILRAKGYFFECRNFQSFYDFVESKRKATKIGGAVNGR